MDVYLIVCEDIDSQIPVRHMVEYFEWLLITIVSRPGL